MVAVPVDDYPLPVLAFANRPELLDDVPALRRLLARIGEPPAAEPTPVQLAKLRRLREVLRALGELVAGGRLPDDEELAPLNRFIAEVPVEQRLERRDDVVVARSTALASGWDAAPRDLAGRFAALLVRHDPTRLRLCENPDCGHLLYDASKSRTGRWCGVTCGNRMRVRRHRARSAGRGHRA
jgi:predicted RNA-binding Zn ribbon-like protein